MTNSAPKPISEVDTKETVTAENPPTNPKIQDSYVKLAMRNMVRKGKQSLWHFFLTTAGLVGLLVGLAYLTKP
ncbi:DUF3285 domain-containing protein [Waterburya agarophytonicola K14]|uniref:DUF3285 domain-containing protein n=1 Tax=Waterburya agarophytonicola KI4 TaxID=2874699 RepID=A0A964BUQ8_9CYAN|nr:DUF3285 domain-containing protein [Waterburya agarophytonicola]MCC0179032.1 DUF3285 domain-containing protein [Waterburya agarophytonicola KI4]